MTSFTKIGYKNRNNRSSRPNMFCEKGVLVFLEISQNSQENTCARVSGLRSVTLLKQRLWHRCFPMYFAKFLRAPSFTEHFRWLLLKQTAPRFENPDIGKTFQPYTLIGLFVKDRSLELHFRIKLVSQSKEIKQKWKPKEL